MDVVRGLSSGTIDALKSLFVALAFIAVILRLVANWLYTRRLLVDDCKSPRAWLSFIEASRADFSSLFFSLSSDISICAIPFLIGVSVLSDMAGNGNCSTCGIRQFGRKMLSASRLPRSQRGALAVAISVLTPLALWSCKAPILFLYLRVFGLKRWLRIASSITLVLIGLVYISGIVAIPPACTPHTRNLSQQFIETCQERTRATNVYLGSVSVVADVVILVLPMPVIFGLKLLVPSRIGLLFLFISGLFAIAASIISLYFKAMSLKVPGTSLAISILATLPTSLTPPRITECSVAVIVGCVPSLRVLWSKILKRSAPTTTTEIATDATEDRMNRSGSSPQDSDVEGRPNRKTLDPNAMLVVSTQVHTSRTILTDQHTASPSAYQGRPYYVQAYYRPGREQSDEESQPPFGVYAEAYALQTRHQGGWAR
ncbi:hypothetical protein F4861DRAFT_540134 [Xylaria intraflava]|nr:hypothetical protein F4861DRAFT_540134 [Xylaria intraflava]